MLIRNSSKIILDIPLVATRAVATQAKHHLPLTSQASRAAQAPANMVHPPIQRPTIAAKPNHKEGHNTVRNHLTNTQALAISQAIAPLNTAAVPQPCLAD